MYKSICVFHKDGKEGEENTNWDADIGISKAWGGVLGRVGQGSMVSFCAFVLISVFCATGD